MRCAMGVVFWFLVVVGNAHAHGVHQWVANKELRDPTSGAFCCGPLDCHAVDDGAVREVTGGWRVQESLEVGSEVIPYARGLPFSPDGQFHRCGLSYPIGAEGKFEYQTRCWIVPPGST